MSSGGDQSELLAFLLEQDHEFLQRLYDSPTCALAIYRLVPQLAQQWIARCAFLPKPISVNILEEWTEKESLKEGRDCIALLVKLAVFHVDESPAAKDVTLTTNFKKSIRIGFSKGPFSVATFELYTKDISKKNRKSHRELEMKGVERWECLLQYLALPIEQTQEVSAEMRDILTHSKLISDASSSGSVPEITSAGFQYLLMDRTKQIWTYILKYFEFHKVKYGRDLTEFDSEQYADNNVHKFVNVKRLMEMLLRLSFCSPAVAYKLESDWSEPVHSFVQHLRELGMIFIRKRKDGYFFATPLIGHLTGERAANFESNVEGNGSVEDSNKSAGFLVVETNYRVYAYTESALQLAILSTFCEMLYRFPNMAVGVLTRESVRRALQVGIRAEQIVGYLRSHAQEQVSVQKTPQPLPVTVCDQIRLWELERDRLRFNSAVCYENFESEEDYQNLRNFMQKDSSLLWEDENNKLVIGTESGYETVKTWWKHNKKTR